MIAQVEEMDLVAGAEITRGRDPVTGTSEEAVKDDERRAACVADGLMEEAHEERSRLGRFDLEE
jgi:hypothetical protein